MGLTVKISDYQVLLLTHKKMCTGLQIPSICVYDRHTNVSFILFLVSDKKSVSLRGTDSLPVEIKMLITRKAIFPNQGRNLILFGRARITQMLR